MKQKINSTDLHIKYKIEEDGDYQWPNGVNYSGNYHSTLGYSREYALWIEEQYIELFNNQTNQTNKIEELESDKIYLEERIETLEEEIFNLNDELMDGDL